MRQYLAIVLTFFSLSLTTGNALATTLENIEKFNKDQFIYGLCSPTGQCRSQPRKLSPLAIRKRTDAQKNTT